MRRTIEDDAKKILAVGEYATPSNYVAGDGYFDEDCKAHWGEAKWRDTLNAVMEAYKRKPPHWAIIAQQRSKDSEKVKAARAGWDALTPEQRSALGLAVRP